ncbi:MAG: ParB/RepB/Spo0J family partition protein [Calothrix sp. FI2-JRJ7]|jgi:ParB family chromosome partitioning protein|nr:ParB/RepB/Spo0J family partition protein [Calothrix sp. FI2-JRJ7]
MRKKTLPVPKMRGVEDLLSVNESNNNTGKPLEVAIDKIKVNNKQPRRWFDPLKMAQLIESVREYGILEPLLVRPLEDGEYELIAGERRLRAASDIGLATVPIVVKELSDKQALSVSILENLQREDLNPVEEVEAILELLSINLDVPPENVKSILNLVANSKKRNIPLTDHTLRQLEQIESTLTLVGRFNASSFRTTRLPLLNLPQDVLTALRQGKLEYTKARAIALVKDSSSRTLVLEKTINEDLSLTQIKELIEQLNSEQKPTIEKEKEKQLAPDKILSQRCIDFSKRIKDNKVFSDARKRKKLEKLFDDIDKLLTPPEEESSGESSVENENLEMQPLA